MKVGIDTGVLVMAYGGPESLDEIPGYLADIRSGRTTSRAILEEITGNYRSIGGRSSLPVQTRTQIAALSRRFEREPVRFFEGMRHWSPWIEDAVGSMLEAGIRKAVSLVLAPHYSSMSIDKYEERILQGEELFRGRIAWQHVKSYHNGKRLIEAFSRRVRSGMEAWSESERGRVHVIFSAHSLPERILKEGDPYQDQLLETAGLIAAQCGLSKEQWSWCYQSAGRTPEPWLGPAYETHVEALRSAGITDAIAVPVGFVSDHVEILFDIDIKAQEKARDLGMRLVRPPALNDDPLFIDQLEITVRDALDRLNR